MSRLRVVIISDSLGLPRQLPEFVRLEATWPQLVRDELPDACVYQLSLGGATTDDLVGQLSYLLGQQPSLVIVQAGIVDCAPRAFRQSELLLLQSTRLGRLVLNRLERSAFVYLRRIRGVSYVSESRFGQNIERVLGQFDCPVIWISIVGRSDYDSFVPNVSMRIRSYNALLERRLGAHFLDLSTHIADQHMMADGHHLNEAGHRALMDKLARHPAFASLKSIVSSRRADG
ncbi:MAG TPA: SGNH/GDSL hydrolase family protein [Steroidobacter sp.]